MLKFYTCVSFHIPVPQEQQAWAIDQIEGGTTKAMTVTCKQYEDRVWIHSDDCNVDELAKRLSTIMENLDVRDAWCFEWCEGCRRPMPDSCGGGVCIITKNGFEFMTTSRWKFGRLSELGLDESGVTAGAS